MVLPVRLKFMKRWVCLSAVAWPLVAEAGTFESISNASTFPRIYNASESNEDWLGYSCASIGGKAHTAVIEYHAQCATISKETRISRGRGPCA